MNERVLVVEDEPEVAEAIAEGLAHCGRDVIICYDTEAAELVLEYLKPDHVISDVRLTGPFRYEGLDFLDQVRLRGGNAILVSGDVPAALRSEALRRGAAGVLQKPFGISDIEEILGAPVLHGDPCTDGAITRIPSFDEILNPGRLHPQFQPIVHVGDSSPFGFESLARFDTASLLKRPDLLFAYATRKGRVGELEKACIARTFEVGAPLAALGVMFLNVHPAVLNEGESFSDFVFEQAARHEVPLDRIVLELTEQQQLSSRHPFLETIATLREGGIRFAFDDVGVAYSHLPLLDQVRPAFLKVSQDFGTDFELDATRSKLVRNLFSLANEFGASLILEGIETAATADAARELTIPLAQGYHYARPAPVEKVLEWAGSTSRGSYAPGFRPVDAGGPV